MFLSMESLIQGLSWLRIERLVYPVSSHLWLGNTLFAGYACSACAWFCAEVTDMMGNNYGFSVCYLMGFCRMVASSMSFAVLFFGVENMEASNCSFLFLLGGGRSPFSSFSPFLMGTVSALFSTLLLMMFMALLELETTFFLWVGCFEFCRKLTLSLLESSMLRLLIRKLSISWISRDARPSAFHNGSDTRQQLEMFLLFLPGAFTDSLNCLILTIRMKDPSHISVQFSYRRSELYWKASQRAVYTVWSDIDSEQSKAYATSYSKQRMLLINIDMMISLMRYCWKAFTMQNGLGAEMGGADSSPSLLLRDEWALQFLQTNFKNWMRIFLRQKLMFFLVSCQGAQLVASGLQIEVSNACNLCGMFEIQARLVFSLYRNPYSLQSLWVGSMASSRSLCLGVAKSAEICSLVLELVSCPRSLLGSLRVLLETDALSLVLPRSKMWARSTQQKARMLELLELRIRMWSDDAGLKTGRKSAQKLEEWWTDGFSIRASILSCYRSSELSIAICAINYQQWELIWGVESRSETQANPTGNGVCC